MSVAQPIHKRVLYYAGRRALSARFFRDLRRAGGFGVVDGADGPVVTCCGAEFAFVARHDVQAALDALHHDFFNFVILDLRDPADGGRRTKEFEQGLALLDAMDQEPDVELRYGFHRVVALVSSSDAAEIDLRMTTLGVRGVGRVMRDPSHCELREDCALLPSRPEAARAILEEMTRLTLHRKIGKLALCASGGGITGLYFEMGALKCFEDCCSPGALNSFDLYFGISAGGVVAALLANGYTITELMAAVAQVEGGRIPPLDFNLLGASHLDVRGLMAPVWQILGLAGKSAVELLRGRWPFQLESLVFEYGDLIHAPFNTGGFEQMLRRSFTREGCTNDFRALRRPLFIGATDQDRKEHVLFGEPPHDQTSISEAIRASMSLNPVFAATNIDGRYYEDGAVTRTSNFVDAINKGADLVIVLDPLVPYVTKRPGFSRGRGVFYNADQDIRTVLYTRYETTRGWVLRRHPYVSMYTFLPNNTLRRTLSVNPMDHRPYLEVWRGAYLSTLRRIHALGHRMRGDFAFHGVGIDTARADAVAARLDASPTPAFSDFFPDGRVEFPAVE